MKLYIRFFQVSILLLSTKLYASLIEEESFNAHPSSLPQEILISIFESLPNLDRARLVCKQWYNASMNPICILPDDKKALEHRFLNSSPYKFAWQARNDPKGRTKVLPWVTRFYGAHLPPAERKANWSNAKKVGIIENILSGSKKPSIFELMEPIEQ